MASSFRSISSGDICRSLAQGILVLLFVLTVASCSDSTGAKEPAGVELSGPPFGLQVLQGFASKTIVGIHRISQFSGPVQLSATGLPQGMLVSFSPTTLAEPAELSEMTVSALWSLPAGPYSITVRASGKGIESRDITVNVTVTVPTISIAAATDAITLAQGEATEIPLTISRGGGFEGDAGLSILGLPPGVTAQITPSVLEHGMTTSILTLTAILATETGDSPLTLRASSQGIGEVIQPLQLTIVPATKPAILVAPTPAFIAVVPGGSASSSVSIRRFGGFDGAVYLTVDGAPTGVTSTEPPPTAAATEAQLGIATSVCVPSGLYQLTLRASGIGIADATAGMTLQVRQLASGQYNLAFVIPSSPETSCLKLLPVTVNRGGSATLDMVALRYGFNNPIVLSTPGVPPGVTLILPDTLENVTASIQPFSAQLTVDAGAAPGTYPIAIVGDGARLIRLITLELTIP